MSANPLIIGSAQKAALFDLRTKAMKTPINAPEVMELVKTPEGDSRHRKRMDTLTVAIPKAYLVTFSIETGQPIGVCRHMSMSTTNKGGQLPNPLAVWMVCEELGFTDSMDSCTVWMEDLEGDRKAVNILQPISLASTKPIVV